MKNLLDRFKEEPADDYDYEDEGDKPESKMDLEATLMDRLAEKVGVESPEALIKLIKVVVKSCMERSAEGE